MNVEPEAIRLNGTQFHQLTFSLVIYMKKNVHCETFNINFDLSIPLKLNLNL